MPRNGQGIYSKPEGTTAVPNTTIESSKYNDVIDDLVDEANRPRPISAGGTGAQTAEKAIKNLGLDKINSDQDAKINDALTKANNAVSIANKAIGPDGGTTTNLTASSLTVNGHTVTNSLNVSGDTILGGALQANEHVNMAKGLDVMGSIGTSDGIRSGTSYFDKSGGIFGSIWEQSFGNRSLSAVIAGIRDKANEVDGKARAGALCQYQSSLIESPQYAVTTGVGGQMSQLTPPYVLIGVRIEYGKLYVRGVALKNQ